MDKRFSTKFSFRQAVYEDEDEHDLLFQHIKLYILPEEQPLYILPAQVNKNLRFLGWKNVLLVCYDCVGGY